ncbi:MAG TPA: hypothetical protein VNF47_17855 [Streptosporangiaceae bacterium]|nr:hypothetical protein [Streptosporangiaceae bacterium]
MSKNDGRPAASGTKTRLSGAKTPPSGSRVPVSGARIPVSRPNSPAESAPAIRPGASLVDRSQGFAAEWAPTAGRVMLGLVLAWFGYHELVQPQLWTGYVPGVSATSDFAMALVLVHGWALLMLAVAIVAGLALRLAAAVAAVLLAQVVITLTITGGLTDLTLRDVGVLGLAIVLTGTARQRVALTS